MSDRWKAGKLVEGFIMAVSGGGVPQKKHEICRRRRSGGTFQIEKWAGECPGPWRHRNAMWRRVGCVHCVPLTETAFLDGPLLYVNSIIVSIKPMEP